MRYILNEELFDEDEYQEEKSSNRKPANLPEDFNEINLEKMGTSEYEANKGREKHIKTYRKFANMLDDEPITEDNINEWALNKTATMCNREPAKIRAEILNQKWSDYEI